MKITRRQLRRIIRESMSRYVGPTVSDDMVARINRIRRGDLQDHLYDIVDAIESGSPDYTLDMLKKNIEDAERLDEGAALRRKISRMINERIDVIDRETGEVMVLGRAGREAAPEEAWPDLVRRLGLKPDDYGLDAAGDQSFLLSNQEFTKLEDEVLGKQDRRSAKRKSAQMAADRERLNIDNLLARLQDWAVTAADEYQADNPDMNIQDVAYDLADAWEYEFEPDEREELMWHFDGDLNDLKIYTAESM